MSKKNQSDKHGFVYSTDPNFRFENEEESNAETLPAKQQKLRIRLDTKHSGGKAVTLVEGFIGKEEYLEDLGKELQNYCGTGGSARSCSGPKACGSAGYDGLRYSSCYSELGWE